MRTLGCLSLLTVTCVLISGCNKSVSPDSSSSVSSGVGSSGVGNSGIGSSGDIKVIHLNAGQEYFVRNGCLLAAMDHIEMDTKAQKLSAGLFSGAGLFVLHLKGSGGFAVSAFGAIMELNLAPGQQYMVDNGHLVAWSGDTAYEIVKAGKNWMSSITSGEGLGCMFTGPGRIYIQTRNPEAFGAWVRKFVPTTSG